MADFREHYCSACKRYTSWIHKDHGIKCTGCEFILQAPGPFHFSEHYCSTCNKYTNWIEAGNGLLVCTGCKQGA